MDGLSNEKERLSKVYEELNQQRFAALCLSGGGIRSATFALGVIQGLARLGLLQKFDYLSTVSGGGYIGSWLSAWIRREPGGLAAVERALAQPTGDPHHPESPPVEYLRSYTRYLSPHAGMFSADTWTLVSTYLRNLLLNWLVFIPMFAAVVVVPRIWPPIIESIRLDSPNAIIALLILGTLLVAFAVAYTVRFQPSAGGNHNNAQRWFLCGCLAPLTLGAVVLMLFWPCLLRHQCVVIRSGWTCAAFVGVEVVTLVLGLAGGSIWRSVNGRATRPDGRRVANAWIVLLVQALAGGVAGSLTWFAASRDALDPTWHPIFFSCFSVPVYLGAFLLGQMALRGLSSGMTTDEDREWSARAGGWVLIVILFWSAAAAVVV